MIEVDLDPFGLISRHPTPVPPLALERDRSPSGGHVLVVRLWTVMAAASIRSA
jgi:hypothetical protein